MNLSRKIILIALTISVLNSCKQKENKSDKIENVTNVPEKHKDERLYKGMLSYIAKTNGVAFYECNQEFTISVVPLKDSDFSSLFDAYKKVQVENDLDFAYVEFNGYITKETISSEMDDMRTIRITKFLKIDKSKSCD